MNIDSAITLLEETAVRVIENMERLKKDNSRLTQENQLFSESAKQASDKNVRLREELTRRLKKIAESIDRTLGAAKYENKENTG